MRSFNGDFPPWRCSGRQRRRGERRRQPLGNKPWKKELHHQECALDKKLGEDASMEEKKEREKERGGEHEIEGTKEEEKLNFEEAIVIIDSIAASDYQSHHDRAPTQRKGIMELDTQNAILAQNKLLMQQIEALTKQIGQLPHQYHQGGPQKTQQAHQVQQIFRCDFCGGNHQNDHVQHLVINNKKRRHIICRAKPDLNKTFKEATKAIGVAQGPQQQQVQPDRLSTMEDTLNPVYAGVHLKPKNTNASIKNLEVQVGQLAKQMYEHGSGSFSATIEVNPREQCKAVTTKRGTMVGLKDGEALEQMLAYAKFMKELLTKKKRIMDDEIELEAGCSATIQKSIPEKSRDPGSFTILVTIGKLSVGRALLDLGASINLMPLSMIKRIREIEIRPTRMALQLADRIIKHPYDDGKLIVRVQGDEVQFNVFEAMKHPKDKGECFQMDVLDELGRIDGDPVLRETRIWATWEYVSSVGEWYLEICRGGQETLGTSGGVLLPKTKLDQSRPNPGIIVMAAQLIHDRVEMECLEGVWETLEGNTRCRFRGTIRFTATSLVHPDEPEVTSSEEDPEEDHEELPPEPAVDALDFLEGDEDPLPEVDSP
ncbi:hypothetical protein D0Y65_015462 [Glycine soja]|uniref:Aspartic peptidase DDI1-type domain-containing protein n=1 Tax=Glycine soja TaxID=3848 RepID=A0A445KD59_GLYSO|nr:hypothetical protein D0Y65_015462 [Glycine soja]